MLPPTPVNLLSLCRNPIVATTSPYTKYQYGETVGIGRRIAMEIKMAYEEDTLSKIVT